MIIETNIKRKICMSDSSGLKHNMENLDVSWEPMDVDVSSLSSQSGKGMDISYNESDITKVTYKTTSVQTSDSLPETTNETNIQPTIKKYHLNIQKHQKQHGSSIFKILLAVLFTFCAIIMYQTFTLRCCDEYNIEELSETLRNKLFGQYEAIGDIIETMRLEDRSKILFFSGGTGVGKTFISSIIMQSLGICSNTYHYTMPSFSQTFSTDLMVGLTMCERSIIIVDDLTANNMNVNSLINNIIEKTEYLNKHVLVILIYNCYNTINEFSNDECNESFHNSLRKNFAHIKSHKRLVQFKPLTNEHLKLCIENEMGHRKLSDIEFDNVLKNFNVTEHGCKGVHSKMKYLNVI